MTESHLKHGRSLLMVAFHFPPCQGSSGLQRTLAFAKFLPRYGWSPLVLTAAAKAYSQVSHNQIPDIPSGVSVIRAFALDTARHLSFKGRYPGWMGLPDRWVSWIPGALLHGWMLIRRHQPSVIWSTYPIATAHLIAYFLHRLTGIPWVADFRDPMVEVDPYTGQLYPSDPWLRRARSWIESKTMESSSCSVFVSEGARKICADRYPEVSRATMKLIPNGYDEETFQRLGDPPRRRNPRAETVLLHSGTLYPTPDRDPKDFFAAISDLKKSGKISANTLHVVLRATGYDERYRLDIEKLGIQEIVTLEPSLPYADALREMLSADGLLIFQGYTSNPAIPAKLYEYLRARRPIFAMAHGAGDTAGLLSAVGVGRIAPLDSRDEIASSLLAFLDDIHQGNALVLPLERLTQLTRESRAAELANVLEDVAR